MGSFYALEVESSQPVGCLDIPKGQKVLLIENNF
jgi:hypothetical protein